MRERLGQSWVAVAVVLALVSRVYGELPSELLAADEAKMILVPAGPFVMGTGAGAKEEAPPHLCDLPAYYIDATEVTTAQYAKYLQAAGSAPPTGWSDADAPSGRETLPITNITWFEAMRYAIWAGKRLPTEAEWEKAARGTDGRRFPWGSADDDKRRNIDSNKLGPVGQFAAGASPYAVLDMSGNAWEWTADWFDAYPGASAGNIQFGKGYKVMRGGGGEYYYGLPNTGTTTQRARALPYGGHDFLGFRCVKSVDPAKAPYDPKQLLAEAESQLNASLREPVSLAYESEYDKLLNSAKIPLTITGSSNRPGQVRAGFALPKGLIKDPARLVALGPDGEPRPTQPSRLASWEDGSTRWALLEFPAAASETCFVDLSGGQPAPKPRQDVRVSQAAEGATIETGAVIAEITRDGLLRQVRRGDGVVLFEGMVLALDLADDTGTRLHPLTAERIDIEETGPLSVIVRLRGVLGTDKANPSPMRYDLRITAKAGSSRLHLLLTLTHMARRVEPTENVAPMIKVKAAAFEIGLPQTPSQSIFGTDRGAVVLPAGHHELLQQDDLRFRIVSGNNAAKNDVEGTRAPGWLAAKQPAGWCVLGVRHFWQNHPKSLYIASDSALGVGLWAGPQPIEWEGGLAKTHEIVLDFSDSQPAECDLSPLRATMPPAWACGTEALGAPMLPRGKEAIERFPYWELVREASLYKWVRAMPTGLRDYGDAYMGGPYKGKNAFANLEYDVCFNALLEYLRTGQAWYLDAAEPMVRHQADIDTDHFTGQPWKHSPQHTTTYADLGHVFIRGMLLHFLLTGERRSLDVAREIGDWLAATMEKGEGTGNERQIGWSLYAMTGLYDVTRDSKYLHACETLCNRLIEGQSQTGQFTNIRYDNRIAFFNGIAMNGMLAVADHNGDKRIADAVMKVAERTLGMYPEYACRTLNAYVWAARRTNDPRFLDVLDKTWQLSMQYLVPGDPSTTDTHAWRFRHFAAKQRLFPLFEQTPPTLPDPSTWQGVRFKQPTVDLYLQTTGGQPAPIMVIREGLVVGTVELQDLSGRALREVELADTNRIFEPAVFELASSPTAYRLRLACPDATGWQVHYDAAARMTVHDASGGQVPDLYPRAYGCLAAGAGEVKVKLEAMGEGFHMATLYDPQGKPVQTVRHFVDFEDPGRYVLELKAPLPRSDQGDGTGWSLEVCGPKVLSVEGMLPYWSSRPEQWFNPEQVP